MDGIMEEYCTKKIDFRKVHEKGSL